MSDTEATLAALEAASAKIREANHAAHQAPATPQSLYPRSAELVELLGGLRQVTETLCAQVDQTTAAAHAEGAVLDTDDDQPAGGYVDGCCRDRRCAAVGQSSLVSVVPSQVQRPLARSEAPASVAELGFG